MKVLTLGTFDTLHSGHIGLFRQCRRIAGPEGTVVVAVNSDQFVQKYKNRTPLIPYEIRAAVIAELRTVDVVFKNYGDANQPPLIEHVNPDCIVIGEDWAKNNYLAQIGVTQQWLDDRAIQLCYVPRTGDWSSTALRKAHHG
jgi:glycerol-3-phosphate cytidylyltransferase